MYKSLIFLMPCYVIIDLIYYYKQPIRHMGQFRAADLGEERGGVEGRAPLKNHVSNTLL